MNVRRLMTLIDPVMARALAIEVTGEALKLAPPDGRGAVTARLAAYA